MKNCLKHPYIALRGLFLATTILCCSSSVFAASSCPKSFSQFLDRFGTDIVFQNSHIKYPLSYISHNGHGDSCYPDCTSVEDKLSRQKAASLSDPIFPLLSTQLEVPLQSQIKISKSRVVVRLDKPDSDSFSFEFIFKRNYSCWQLVSVRDLSL